MYFSHTTFEVLCVSVPLKSGQLRVVSGDQLDSTGLGDYSSSNEVSILSFLPH